MAITPKSSGIPLTLCSRIGWLLNLGTIRQWINLLRILYEITGEEKAMKRPSEQKDEFGGMLIFLGNLCVVEFQAEVARETLPDVKDAFAIISREESQIGIASSSYGFVTKPQVGHTVDRCFDIIGYPPGYNKNIGPKPNGPRTFNANSVSLSSEKGASGSFTVTFENF
ncbi:hypothetical protein Tco_0660311 [Tanacetum coccineum]